MKAGDLVEVKTKDSSYKGVYMPNSTENKLVLKLDSGYNIGILKKNVKKSNVLKAFVKKTVKKSKIGKKKGKKTITILFTGGTVASKVDYETGGVTAHFSPEDLIGMFPELERIANIDTKLVAEMMSEDMMFSDYQKMLDAIKNGKSDGVILTQGTDTLGYTAAALAFALEEVNIPVLVVGSQRSSDRGSSDAAMNLICAAEFIVKEDFKGVAVCMHDRSSDSKCAIMSATKTRKMHTSRRDAFRVINGSPYAYVDFISRKVEKMGKYPDFGKKLKIRDKFEDKVGILKTHPNMDSKLFEFYCKNYKGIVIEGTGLGHAPTNLGKNLKNYKVLKDYIKKGGIVVVCSQCLFGRVHPHVYVNLRRLEDIGCIFGEDMLPETAFIKLAWLLGSYPKDVKKLLNKDLRGEITDRSLWEEKFLE